MTDHFIRFSHRSLFPQDFDELVAEVHKRKMKIILDFIPNHSSDQHPWFVESRKGGATNPYSDYYVWHDGILDDNGQRKAPNNWVSIGHRYYERSWWFHVVLRGDCF